MARLHVDFKGSSPRWEVDVGLPAAAAVIGVVFLPILATLRGLGVIEIAQQAALALGIIALITVIGAARWLARGREDVGVPRRGVGVALMMLGAAGVVSCAYAQVYVRPFEALNMWQQFVMAMSLVLLSPIYAYLSSSRSLFGPILLGWKILALIAIGTVLAHMLGLASGEAYGSRQFGILGDSVAWLFSALLVTTFERRAWVLFVACGVLLILTQSRVPALIAGAGIILASVLQPKSSLEAMLKRLLVAAALIGAAFAVPLLAPALVERFRETDLLYNDRVETIRYSLSLFRDSPWIGLGYNAHSFYFSQQLGSGNSAFMILSTAVSTPIQILTDFGIVGFLVFAFAMIAILRVCFNLARASSDGVSPGPSTDFFHLARGLACWLIPFIIFNQSAAYLIPLSLIAVVFFSATGIVTAADIQLRAARHAMAHNADQHS